MKQDELKAAVDKLKRNREQVSKEDQQGKYKAAFDKQKTFINELFKETCYEVFGVSTTSYYPEDQEKLASTLEKVMKSHMPAISRLAFIECDSSKLMDEILDMVGDFLLERALIERETRLKKEREEEQTDETTA